MPRNLEEQWRNKMKQFSLDEYLKNPGRKIVTRNGRNVRIICTDRMQLFLDEHYPIVALIKNPDDSEMIACFKDNGQAHENENLDLFFENKKGWVNISGAVTSIGGEIFYAGTIYPTKAEAIAHHSGVGLVDTIQIEWEE